MLSSIKILILVISLFSLIKSDIVSYKEFTCSDTEELEIGKKAILCIHFLELGTRVAYQIEVDEYSVITVTGGFELISQAIENSKFNETSYFSFVAQIGDVLSPTQAVYINLSDKDKSIQDVFKLFNIVIKVDKGKVYQVYWDNDCFACVSSRCYKSEIPLYYNESEGTFKYKNCKAKDKEKNKCVDTPENNAECDPKFYITWFGTDKSENQMKSSNLAMSKFKKYSISSLYNSALGIFDSVLDDIKKEYTNIKQQAKNIIANITSS